MKALVAGWFSFEDMGATAGDLMARDLACAWLTEAGRVWDVALAPPFAGGVDWRTVEPSHYADLVFVCGPFGNGPPVDAMLARFAGCRLIGLDLTMLQPLDDWNPFDTLYERDSSAAARPDIAFAADVPRVPVVGMILIHPQPEYGERDRHRQANDRLRRLLDSREAARMTIDTRLDANGTGLRTAAEIESLIARVDVVVTTRLHGLVLALKTGVPVLAIDPVRGGAKVTRQAEALGWPLLFQADDATDDALQRAFDYCLTGDARAAAHACRTRAVAAIELVHRDFVSRLRDVRPVGSR
ncbi:MAG TPA: polysaccharide pyruvyl transferase family protein [Nitrospirales bacterium]|nr:polysaccharide pyruvyl transferase family protein [Nitrospirales bacterium]